MSINRTAEFLIELVKQALNGSKDRIVCKNVDWDALIEMAQNHGVYGLVGFIIDLCDGVPDEIYHSFENACNMNIYRDVKREILINTLLNSFESNGVDCMPLKGYILKNMYPFVEMRDMCDVDILIHTKDFEEADKLMSTNGFQFKQESPHEYIYTSIDNITIELHKCLVPPYNHTLYSYYGDGWKLAKKKVGYSHLYEMKPEDFYVYEIAHTAKHYLNGGIGIRQIADIYILASHQSEYDIDYIEEQLKELGLEKFQNILLRICNVWFCDGEYDDETIHMANYIINGTLFGNAERAASSEMVRSSNIYIVAVMKRSIRYIFPKRKWLLSRYPILKEKPGLYPFILVYRWFDVLLHRRGRISELKNVPDKETANEFYDHCKAMGISKKL